MENWSPKAVQPTSPSFESFARKMGTEFEYLMQNAWMRYSAVTAPIGKSVPLPPRDIGPKWEIGGTRFVDHLYALRRYREDLLAKDLFADPAWDILLDLYRASLNQKNISISSACIASAVPPTTALRHIKGLEDAGLVHRVPDKRDHRRIYLALTDKAGQAMDRWMEAATGAKSLSAHPSIFR